GTRPAEPARHHLAVPQLGPQNALHGRATPKRSRRPRLHRHVPQLDSPLRPRPLTQNPHLKLSRYHKPTRPRLIFSALTAFVSCRSPLLRVRSPRSRASASNSRLLQRDPLRLAITPTQSPSTIWPQPVANAGPKADPHPHSSPLAQRPSLVLPRRLGD